MGSGRRYPPGWARFRRMILDRDGWRCCECGKPGRMEVSHIVSVKDHPDLELVETNCRTLCRPCHLAHDRRPISAERLAWRNMV